MFTISQSAVEQVLTDIRTGNTEYVDQFFAARPDWQETGTETDKTEEKKEEVTA